MVGYASATCLAWHLLLLDSKDVGPRVWLSLSGFPLNLKWGEFCTVQRSVITVTLEPFLLKRQCPYSQSFAVNVRSLSECRGGVERII